MTTHATSNCFDRCLFKRITESMSLYDAAIQPWKTGPYEDYLQVAVVHPIGSFRLKLSTDQNRSGPIHARFLNYTFYDVTHQMKAVIDPTARHCAHLPLVA